MIRSLAFLASLLVLAPAMATAADSDQHPVAVNGNVANLCVLGAPNPAAIDLGQLAATSGARVGKITTLGEQTIALPDSFCNFAGTQLTVQASALLASDTSAVQPGFSRAVNFTSTVNNWALSPATVTTAATAGGGSPNTSAKGGTQPAPKIANLALVLSDFTVPSDNLMVAGAYAGSVTITLGPSASE